MDQENFTYTEFSFSDDRRTATFEFRLHHDGEEHVH
jgi:hypothetical protein